MNRHKVKIHNAPSPTNIIKRQGKHTFLHPTKILCSRGRSETLITPTWSKPKQKMSKSGLDTMKKNISLSTMHCIGKQGQCIDHYDHHV